MRGINFRPKVDPGKLLQIAKKQNYSDLSGFINDAIEEKIRHIHEDPRDHKLMSSLKKAVYEYNGWTFSKPPVKEAVKIKGQAEKMRSGKAKSVPLSDIIHKLEKLPAPSRK
jgi:vacuolar-type H+-ATPase subunit E/Vma4